MGLVDILYHMKEVSFYSCFPRVISYILITNNFFLLNAVLASIEIISFNLFRKKFLFNQTSELTFCILMLPSPISLSSP